MWKPGNYEANFLRAKRTEYKATAAVAVEVATTTMIILQDCQNDNAIMDSISVEYDNPMMEDARSTYVIARAIPSDMDGIQADFL